MLKPSGGLFKKLFSPDRMLQAKKKVVPTPKAESRPVSRMPRGGGAGLLGRAVGRKAY